MLHIYFGDVYTVFYDYRTLGHVKPPRVYWALLSGLSQLQASPLMLYGFGSEGLTICLRRHVGAPASCLPG